MTTTTSLFRGNRPAREHHWERRGNNRTAVESSESTFMYNISKLTFNSIGQTFDVNCDMRGTFLSRVDCQILPTLTAELNERKSLDKYQHIFLTLHYWPGLNGSFPESNDFSLTQDIPVSWRQIFGPRWRYNDQKDDYLAYEALHPSLSYTEHKTSVTVKF